MVFPIIKLKEVLSESKVEAAVSDNSKRIRVRLHAKGVEKRPEMNDKEGATKYYVRRAGQFVYGRQNLHKGAFGVIPSELDGYQSSSDIPSFDVDERCLPEWVDLFLKQGGYYLELSKLATGVGSQRISPSKFLSLAIPLPSVEQQRKILDQVSFYENSQQQITAELTHQQTLLKKLRQQILQEAIEGKLTADWRAQNPDVEPASELLKRIAAEKEQLIKDKKIKAQKPLSLIIEEEKPFELPQGWEWCRLFDLCSKTGSGSTPAGGRLSYVDSGVKFIRSQNVYNDGFRWNDEAYISKSIHQKMISTSLEPADLLLNITGGSIGRCCILPEDFDEGNINQHVAILRCTFMEHGAFLHSVICSPYFQAEIIKAQTGAGREGLPKNKMDNILIPLPSYQEQQAIVTKVENLLTLCNQLEAQIAQNQAHAEQLVQAVLKEAFSYNSKAEPASVISQASTHLPDAVICGD